MNDDQIAGRSVVLSLDRLHTPVMVKSSSVGEIKRYFVEAIENVLHDDLELFEGGEKIWPDQCDATVFHLNTLIARVQKLCAAIDDKLCTSLTVTTSPSNYALIVKLHYAHMQLCRLRDLVTVFRSSCQRGSKRIGKKREEICHWLHLFRLHSEDMLQSIALLQEDYLLERLAQSASEMTAALSPSLLAECKSSSCLRRPPVEREVVNLAQWKRSHIENLRRGPEGHGEEPHALIQNAEEDVGERPFSE
jgi:hypothetical protein